MIEKGVTGDALTRTYEVKILVNNSNHKLLPGMVANVKLSTGTTSTGPSPITLPVTAVQQSTTGDHFVWTVDSKGKASRTTVTVGNLVGNRIVITSGLSEGQRVIVEGYQKVSDGEVVTF